jgi:hypothetical protein
MVLQLFSSVVGSSADRAAASKLRRWTDSVDSWFLPMSGNEEPRDTEVSRGQDVPRWVRRGSQACYPPPPPTLATIAATHAKGCRTGLPSVASGERSTADRRGHQTALRRRGRRAVVVPPPAGWTATPPVPGPRRHGGSRTGGQRGGAPQPFDGPSPVPEPWSGWWCWSEPWQRSEA